MKAEWQSIDTAPKDGSDILTYDISRSECSVRFWGVAEDDESDWQPRIRGVFPTHWMPLPEPPNDYLTKG